MKHLRFFHFPHSRVLTRFTVVAVIFLIAFFSGRFLGFLSARSGSASSAAVRSSPVTSLPVSAEGNWGLSFQQEGKPPVANATSDYLKQFNAHYADDTDEKILYLTFDAGYENGNTPAILDALKKHHAPATFFIVGNYIQTSPDLVKRMIAEGHTVGNHTFHHPDMSKIATKKSFSEELESLKKLFEETTGQTMTRFYRPPQGKYSESNLQMAKELGYHTFFWSLAYVDWYEDRQPTHEEAFQKLLGRIHPARSCSYTAHPAQMQKFLTNFSQNGRRWATRFMH